MIPLLVAILDRLGPGAWLRIEPGQLPGLHAELAQQARRGKMPALQFGQDQDLRVSLPDGRSLHAHLHTDGMIVAHLDQVDPYRSGAAHWLRDTYAGKGALAGAALGLRFGAAGVLLGGLLGGWLGSRRDKRGGVMWALVLDPVPKAVRIGV